MTSEVEDDQLSLTSDFSIIPDASEVDTESLKQSYLAAGFGTDGAAGGYSQVEFLNVCRHYPAQQDLLLYYRFTGDYKPTVKDRLALYRVGFTSPQHYQVYEWAPREPLAAPPPDIATEQSSVYAVNFANSRLPEDRGEFYQACYVSDEQKIRGVSTPFQLLREDANSSLESDAVGSVDQSDGSVLVTSDLSSLHTNISRLQQCVKRVQDEKAGIEKQLAGVQQQLRGNTDQIDQLQAKAATLSATMEKERLEAEAAAKAADDRWKLQHKEKDLLEEALNAARDEVVRLTNEQTIHKQKELALEEKLQDNETLFTDYTTSMAHTQELLVQNIDMVAALTDKQVLLKAELNKTQNERDEARKEVEFWTETSAADKDNIHSMAGKFVHVNEELISQMDALHLERQELEKTKKDLADNREYLVRDREALSSLQEVLSLCQQQLRDSQDRQGVLDCDNRLLQGNLRTLHAASEELQQQLRLSESRREGAERVAEQLSEEQQLVIIKCELLENRNNKLKQDAKMLRGVLEPGYGDSEARDDCLDTVDRGAVAADQGEDTAAVRVAGDVSVVGTATNKATFTTSSMTTSAAALELSGGLELGMNNMMVELLEHVKQLKSMVSSCSTAPSTGLPEDNVSISGAAQESSESVDQSLEKSTPATTVQVSVDATVVNSATVNVAAAAAAAAAAPPTREPRILASSVQTVHSDSEAEEEYSEACDQEYHDDCDDDYLDEYLCECEDQDTDVCEEEAIDLTTDRGSHATTKTINIEVEKQQPATAQAKEHKTENSSQAQQQQQHQQPPQPSIYTYPYYNSVFASGQTAPVFFNQFPGHQSMPTYGAAHSETTAANGADSAPPFYNPPYGPIPLPFPPAFPIPGYTPAPPPPPPQLPSDPLPPPLVPEVTDSARHAALLSTIGAAAAQAIQSISSTLIAPMLTPVQPNTTASPTPRNFEKVISARQAATATATATAAAVANDKRQASAGRAENQRPPTDGKKCSESVARSARDNDRISARRSDGCGARHADQDRSRSNHGKPSADASREQSCGNRYNGKGLCEGKAPTDGRNCPRVSSDGMASGCHWTFGAKAQAHTHTNAHWAHHQAQMQHEQARHQARVQHEQALRQHNIFQEQHERMQRHHDRLTKQHLNLEKQHQSIQQQIHQQHHQQRQLQEKHLMAGRTQQQTSNRPGLTNRVNYFRNMMMQRQRARTTLHSGNRGTATNTQMVEEDVEGDVLQPQEQQHQDGEQQKQEEECHRGDPQQQEEQHQYEDDQQPQQGEQQQQQQQEEQQQQGEQQQHEEQQQEQHGEQEEPQQQQEQPVEEIQQPSRQEDASAPPLPSEQSPRQEGSDDGTLNCPMCPMRFSKFSSELMQQHMESHLELICPICNTAYQSANEGEFMQHVNNHFDEENLPTPDPTSAWLGAADRFRRFMETD